MRTPKGPPKASAKEARRLPKPRKDYEDRRRRQAQGIEKAKSAQKYRGRLEDAKRNEAIVKMLEAKQTWSSIIAATGCSRSTLSRLIY
jgi:DNA invertase Pin-like site-specific DNA recombinase